MAAATHPAWKAFSGANSGGMRMGRHDEAPGRDPEGLDGPR